MTAHRITELEQRIAKLEKQVAELGEVVTQSKDVKAVGLGRGAEEAIAQPKPTPGSAGVGEEPGIVPPGIRRRGAPPKDWTGYHQWVG